MLTPVRSKIHELKNHAGFKRYAANTSWMMGEKILRMFVGLFVGIWVARYLGPEQFGLFSYAQSLVFLFVAIATLGLDGILVRELVKDESRRDELLGTAFGLKLIGALLILPVLWLTVQFTSNDSYTNLLVFIIASATIFQSFNVIDFYYQSKVQSKYVAWANSLALGVSSAIKVALILNQAPLMAFAIMVAFDALVLATGLVFFYKVSSRQKLFHWSFKTNTAKKLLKDSWPLILSGLLVSVYMKIDQVMIKEMLDVEAVGQYAAAVRLSEAWYFIPMVIANSLFPAILNAKKINKEIYLQRLQRLYTLMIWMAVGIALPMTFLSEWLITLLYGVAYSETGGVLMVHIWAGVFVFLGVASGKWLVAEGMTIIAMNRTLAGMVINVLLNLLLIPLYGVLGAAMATLVSQIVAALLYDAFDRRTRFQFFLKLKAFVGTF
ncbi:flippase [Marinobacter gelidimuriae]|uniref:flippase n=1 Tax=Marinobacter gelidimuriae TaxID=2739064 RepID=UPI000363DD15|nr:flippase [Marinobacter gelidimuriae]